MLHVIKMTLAGTAGLIAVFLVDLIDFYFLSMLGEQEVAASIGFSGQLIMFSVAFSIGLSITVGVLAAKYIGANDEYRARNIITNIYIFALILIGLFTTFILIYLTDLLSFLGAKGRTLELAVIYSKPILLSSPIFALSLVSGGVFRAIGDAKSSMNMTFIAAIINLCLDPLFIFVFDMGVLGASLATVIARLGMFLFTLFMVFKVHKLIQKPQLNLFFKDIKLILKFAVPTILTNFATPLGGIFVLSTMAKFGDNAVAAYTFVGKIIPVAFAVLFALSGVVGPIIGQNLGAKRIDRVRNVLKDALLFTIIIVLTVSLFIFLIKDYMIVSFNLKQGSADLVLMFCSGFTLFFIFEGIIYCCNAVFNSLGHPIYSTYFNYAKIILGVIPFVWLLSANYGAKGVIIGQSIGPVLVSIVALLICFKLINKIELSNKTTKL